MVFEVKVHSSTCLASQHLDYLVSMPHILSTPRASVVLAIIAAESLVCRFSQWTSLGASVAPNAALDRSVTRGRERAIPPRRYSGTSGSLRLEARIALTAVLLATAVFGAAQKTEPPNGDQTQTNNSPGTPSPAKKFPAVEFDPSPQGLIASPGAIEVSQQNKGTERGREHEKDSSKSSKEIVVAPFPISNPALGSGLVVVGGYLFPISKKDETSPNSMIGGGGFYTSNGSWLWGAGAKLYLKHDRYRITGVFGRAQLHYDLYGIGNAAGSQSTFIPINQGGRALLVEPLIRVGNKLFIGPRYQWRSLDATVKGENLPPAFNIDSVELKSTTSSLGFHLQRDLRDNQFYPRAGSLSDVVADFFQGKFGSDFSYQSYTFAFNKYSGLSPHQVLAFRIFGCAMAGNVPFYDLCLLGMHNDVRGYKAGRYRDKLMLTGQAEYRLELPRRFGLAAFFGVGEVSPSIGAFNNDNLKPGGGAGIRYTLAKKNHVNLRIDYALGLQGGGIYMGVSESF